MQSDVVRVDEVSARLDCSTRKVYEVIKKLNTELQAKGYITIAGRVPRTYFEEKCMIGSKSQNRGG